jgi:hypothetical protein
VFGFQRLKKKKWVLMDDKLGFQRGRTEGNGQCWILKKMGLNVAREWGVMVNVSFDSQLTILITR